MKIWKHYNEKTKRDQWQARFVINGKQLRPKADTKKELELIVNEIRRAENREDINKKHRTDLEITCYIPTLVELFDKVLTGETSPKQKQFAKRVSTNFLELLPLNIKVNEITSYHFQLYIDYRESHVGVQTKKPLTPQTINKELHAISGGLSKAPLYFVELENWKRPVIPLLKEKEAKRRFNIGIEQFNLLLETLRKKRIGKQTIYTEQHRLRLADELEFRLETGLRRKEVVRLEFKQYVEANRRLKNVKRFKTDTTTEELPLSRRAVELIEARKKKFQDYSSFIFTKNGESIDSDYRTLKEVCATLNIPYGRYTKNGFVPHDLRHQMGTKMARAGDIETARQYLGHSNVKQTMAYLDTSVQRMEEALDHIDKIKYKKIDIENLLRNSFDEIKKGLMTKENFLEIMNKTFGY